MSIPYTRPQLDALLTGRTADIALPSGMAYFYYGADGAAGLQMPDGTRRQGTWHLDEDCYQAQWPGMSPGRTQILPGPEGWQTRDAASGDLRGVIVALRPGNPEGL